MVNCNGSAVESESLKKSKSRKKSDKVGKVGFDFLSDFWQKKYLIKGKVHRKKLTNVSFALTPTYVQ